LTPPCADTTCPVPSTQVTAQEQNRNVPPKIDAVTADSDGDVVHWLINDTRDGRFISGWQIYNASPLLPFTFPRWMTLGGWLGGGIAWHLSAMWVFFADGFAYLAYGILSGHFRRDILPPRPKIILRDLDDALQFRLRHQLGSYKRCAAPALHGGDHRDLSGGRYRIFDLEARPDRLAYRPVRRLPVARTIHPRTLVSMLAPVRSELDSDSAPRGGVR
jgi:hypothetical protein